MKKSGLKDNLIDASVIVELLASMRRGDPSIQCFDSEESGGLKAIIDEAKALALHCRAQSGTTQTLLDEYFSGSPDLLCATNANGLFVQVNPSFARIFGYTKQELLVQNFLSFIHPDDLSSTVKAIESLRAGTLSFENRYRCKSGEYRIIAWLARLDSISGHIFVSGRDVTNKNGLDKSLKSVIPALNEMAIIVYLDANGQISEINENASKMTGYSRTEILEYQHPLFFSSATDPAFFWNVWSSISCGNTWSGDIKNKRKDGSSYWVRTLISPIHDSEIGHSGYISIQFDISEQKEAEQFSQKIADDLKEAQAVAKIGSWAFDIVNNHLTWSSEHYKICEIDEPQAQEDLYRLYRQHIHKSDLQELDRLVERAVMHGENFIYDHRLVCNDGSIKYVKGIGKVTKDHEGLPIRISGTCQDITEAVLRQQESRYILDELGIGIWKWDLMTNALEWDANMYKLYDINPKDFNGAYDAWEQSLSPETKEKTLSEIMAAVRGEKDFDTTFQIVQKNTGDLQAIRSRALVLRNEQGQATKMWGINIDRTREARLELELTKATKFLEQTGDMAKVGGWELDLRTGKVDITRQTQILHEIDENYKPLPYSTGSEWYPPEAWPIIQSAVAAAIERGVPYDLESPFITAKGRRIWVRVQGFPLVEDGRITRLRGTFQDISERKKAEENLTIFKNVLDNATDFFGIFDTSMQPIYVNPFGRKLVGLSLDWDVGQTKLEEYYPDDLRAELVPLIESSIKSGGLWTGETEYRHFKSNEKIAVANTHFSVRRAVDGEILGYAAIARDIRAEKKLEREAQEASQQLEMERAKAVRNAKLASLGEMSAGIAHEINNPLTIIHGTVRALPKFINDPEKLNAKIANIQSASDRISKIVRSLRKFSRTAEKSDYKIHSLAEIIQEAIVLTGAKAQRHSTRLELESWTDCRIFCDEIELEQVFVNMINNAIDAVKNRPDPWVILRLTDSDRHAIVQIRDSGLGISPDVQKKLFQPFFTTKPVGQGTGLGLSIVKGILDEHQATIEILNHDPHTCFEVRFLKVEDKHEAA